MRQFHLPVMVKKFASLITFSKKTCRCIKALARMFVESRDGIGDGVKSSTELRIASPRAGGMGTRNDLIPRRSFFGVLLSLYPPPSEKWDTNTILWQNKQETGFSWLGEGKGAQTPSEPTPSMVMACLRPSFTSL